MICIVIIPTIMQPKDKDEISNEECSDIKNKRFIDQFVGFTKYAGIDKPDPVSLHHPV